MPADGVALIDGPRMFVVCALNPMAEGFGRHGSCSLYVLRYAGVNMARIEDFLSNRGRAICFPYHGVLGQAAEARGKRFDATIGIALDDDRTPMRLVPDDCQLSLDPKEIYPYAPGFGVQTLREAWMKFLKQKNPSLCTCTSIPVVTSGLTHALCVAGYLFLNPGDAILMADHYWDNYEMIFERMYGASLACFHTLDGVHFNIDALQKALQDSKSERIILLLNFPNNPTGYTVTQTEADMIVAILSQAAAKKNVVVLVDDAYIGLVYEDGILQESLFGRLADLHEHLLAVKIDGATKEDFVWGHRVGFITFARRGMTEEEGKTLADKAGGVIRATISNAPHISQSWLVHLYNSRSYEVQKKEKFAILKGRYHKVREVLRDEKYAAVFHALPCNSGYFMCLELQEGLRAETVRRELLQKFNTGVIAVGERLLRVAFSAIPESDIPKLFENIYEACTSLRALQHA